MGTSPYPVDDIEFDLEDDVQYADDNSMLGDAPASIDPMQADDDPAQPDDHMYDETFDEEIVFDDEPEKIDLEMNAGDHDNVDAHDFETEHQEDVEFHAVDDSTIESQNQNDSLEAVEASTEDIHELELVDEEDTNTQTYSPNVLEEPIIENTNETEVDDRNISSNDLNALDHAATLQHEVLESTGISDPSKEPEEQPEADNINAEAVSSLVEADQIENENEAVPQQPQVTIGEIENLDDTTRRRSATPAEIHPVTVDYAGTVYTLFPSSHQDTDIIALLEDPAVALLPINSLLKELHKPVADYLGHEDEIVLDIHSLGLHICEDSKYAAELTLSQIIDTYMMLSQNQALGHIEPLHCQLSHRTCLKTQMQYLVDSARGGKTYAEVVEEHIGSPEQENQQEEDTFDNLADSENIVEDLYEDEADPDFPTVEAENKVIEENDNAKPDRIDEVDEVDEVEVHEEDVDDGEAGDYDDHVPQDLQEAVDDEQHVNGDDLANADLAEVRDLTVKHESISTPGNESAVNNIEKQEAEEEEDLFADDASNNDSVNGEENGVTQEDILPDDTKEIAPIDADDFDFDEWDKEAEIEDNATANVPTTPSKSLNAKRKADETDDEFDIEYTPQAKKTRST